MKQLSERSVQWIFYLVAGAYLGTVFLRSILVYQDAPELVWVLGILILWSFLFASESVISVRRPEYFAYYLVLQTFLVFLLLTTAGYPDFFANLIVILSMQVMIRLKLRIWVVWLGLCALITTALLVNTYENEVFALVLLYTAGSVFYGFYAQATRKAEVARAQNLVLARELQEANQKLQSYSAQAEGLVVVRERNRLARDLHDSVTQTVFSMTLAAQSASLLLERDPSRVEAQLDHLGQLAGNALSEMQLLISELKPEEAGRQSLATSLRGYLKGGRLPENLSVELDLQGDQLSDSVEEQSLFHIVQEALNNVVKHAQAAKVQVRLHLTEPMWIEVQDDGRGFDLRQAEASGRVGLFSMRERAVEIGWDLQIKTSPGAGTCIRVEKPLRK